MKRLHSSRIGIDQGSRILFSDFENGGPMWTGSGPRVARHRVVFSEPFAGVPAVSVGLSMWDIDRRTNPRLDLAAENVTAEGFDLVFRTWGDTRIARVRADWLAIGALPDDDLWEIS